MSRAESVDVGAPLSFPVPRVESSAQIQNVFANNLNASFAATEIGFWDPSTLQQKANAGYQASGPNGLVVPVKGVYLVSGQVYCTTSNVRVNIGLEVSLDGVSFDPRSAGGYIRSASGQNESSYDLVAFRVEANAGQRISFNRLRLAAGGTLSAPAGRSFMLVQRIYG